MKRKEKGVVMGTKHAWLSPSKAERWMNCPGSLSLEEKCPVPEPSKYAAEGTAAHEVAAHCLKRKANADTWLGEIVEVDDFKIKVNDEMVEAVQEYIDIVRKDLEEDGLTIKELLIEEKFDFPSVSAHLFGTTDAAYTSPFGRLKVFDLKYGQGTYVEVMDNPQLLIYALGIWHRTGREADEIEIVIVQPRYPGEEHVRRAVYTRSQLITFECELKKHVKAVQEGDKKLKVGEWCKFCPAISICDAKTAQVFSVVPKESPLPEPGTLTPEQIAKVLALSDAISEWASGVHAHAEGLAQAGVAIPGYKLVQKKGHRRWIDEMAVETAFEGQYGEDIYEKKLLSPAKLEKLVGKDAVKEYVEVPDNGTQLVPESAKGEPVQVTSGGIFQKLT